MKLQKNLRIVNLIAVLLAIAGVFASQQPALAFAYQDQSNSASTGSQETATRQSNDSNDKAVTSISDSNSRSEEPAPVPVTRVLPNAVLIARNQLADRLGIPVEAVTIVDYKYVEWRDSCLGLARPGEGCLTVITPGWQVVLSAGGNIYVAHTDLTGKNIRWAPSLN